MARAASAAGALLLLMFTAACDGVTGKVASVSGSWSVEIQTMHGSQPSLSKLVLRRGSAEVDEGLAGYRFFAPDCVIYVTRAPGMRWMAVCGDRAPIQLPEWLLELRDDGPWGGYESTTDANGRKAERWSRLPPETVIAIAQKQPSRTILGVRRTPAAPAFERVYVMLLVAPPPPPPPPVQGEDDPSARELLGTQTLCGGALQLPGIEEPNHDQLAISEVSGGIASVGVSAVGSTLGEGGQWSKVESYVQALVVKRPLRSLRYRPWPDEEKAHLGVIGTVHFRSGEVGHFEAIGQHVCMADARGAVWWISVATPDVFVSR